MITDSLNLIEDTRLTPAGPSLIKPELARAILSFKKQYNSIWLLILDNYWPAVIRPLSKGEWEAFDRLRQISPGLDRDEVLRDFILFPSDIDDPEAPAGYIEVIYDAIEELSGFSRADDLIEAFRAFKNQLEGPMAALDAQAKMFLTAAFRNLTPSDVENLDIMQLAEGLAIAEKFLKVDFDLKTQQELSKQKTLGSRIANQVNTQEDLRELRNL